MSIQFLLTKFRQFESLHKPCKKVFCTTCGGLAHAVEENMSNELDSEIKESLSKLSLSDFESVGEWSEFLSHNYPYEVNLILEREGENIDITSVKDIDNYLLNARRWGRQSSIYKQLLKLGIKMALESENESLIETLCIVLGKKLSGNGELFALAMKKYPANEKIHRVLYNNFRESIPEIRGFIGDGSSAPYY